MMDSHDDAKDERQQYLQQEQYKQQNPLFKGDATSNEESSELGSTDQYVDDEHNNYLHQATNYAYAYVNKPKDLDNPKYLEQNTNYLMGSNVHYMMPDGSPVQDKVVIAYPEDDDREDMTMGRRRMPTMQQLYDSIKTMDETPKIIMVAPPTATTTTTTSTIASKASTALTDSSADASNSYRTIKMLYGNYRIH
jgi:hypothetical protein